MLPFHAEKSSAEVALRWQDMPVLWHLRTIQSRDALAEGQNECTHLMKAEKYSGSLLCPLILLGSKWVYVKLPLVISAVLCRSATGNVQTWDATSWGAY